MLSRLFSRLGTKPKPIFTRSTIERTDWYVSQPLHFARFEDKAWGLQWCEQHGFSSDTLQERTKTLDEENVVAQSNALNNMFERAQKGDGFSALKDDTPASHLENFFTAFKTQPQINVTSALLVMAFSVNRPDVAQYVGTLLERNFEHWIDPLLREPYQDPEIFEQANRAFMQGFQAMMSHPRQMQWFFEHNPSLYTRLKTPENKAKLEKDIVRMPDKERCLWPLVASTVFAHEVHPVSSKMSFYWNPTTPKALNTLLLSFAHDPAAQCTLMRMAKHMDWFYEHEDMLVSIKLASPFISTESITLRKHFQQQSLVGIDEHVIQRVRLLEMAIQKNTTNEEFYQHARTVFAPAPAFALALPELDHNLW